MVGMVLLIEHKLTQQFVGHIEDIVVDGNRNRNEENH